MRITGKEDLEAPIQAVFDTLSQFEVFERSAIRRGIDVQRSSDLPDGTVGQEWQAQFTFRGRPRRLVIRLAQFERPSLMRFDTTSKGVNGTAVIECLALSPRRTRMSVDFSLTANTIAARLFLQSLKLARRNLRQRFAVKFADFAQDIEEKCRKRG